VKDKRSLQERHSRIWLLVGASGRVVVSTETRAHNHPKEVDGLGARGRGVRSESANSLRCRCQVPAPESEYCPSPSELLHVPELGRGERNDSHSARTSAVSTGTVQQSCWGAASAARGFIDGAEQLPATERSGRGLKTTQRRFLARRFGHAVDAPTYVALRIPRTVVA
jgi:hypothetical protein